MSNERASSAHFSMRSGTVRNRTLILVLLALGASALVAMSAAGTRPVLAAAGDLDHFTIVVDGTPNAGDPVTATVTAYSSEGIKTDYTTGAELSNLAASPGCADCMPALPVTGPDYGTLTWADGVGQASVKAFNAESAASITVTDISTGINATSNPFAVGHAVALGGLTIDTVGSQVAGTSFPVTVRAFDPYGNAKLDHTTGALSLPTSPGCSACSPALPAKVATYGTSSWDAGVGTFTNVLAYKAQSPTTITVTDGSVSNTASFDVTHAAALAGLTIDLVGSQVAGTGFVVKVNAFDLYGNPKLDHGSGALSGLDPSVGCSGCLPALLPKSATYGTPSWADGVGTFTNVLAYKALSPTTITVTDGSVSNTASFNVTHSLGLGGFTINNVGSPQKVGTGFNVIVHAFDLYGNIKLNQGGATLSNLADSPNGSHASYGTVSWGSGVGTYTGVKAFKSQLAATIVGTSGTVSNTTNSFDVNPEAAATLVFDHSPFLFNGQPIDTKFNQPINSVCGPYIPAQDPAPANPCAPATSTPMKVLALDTYGNRAASTSVTITSTTTVGGTTTASTTVSSDPTLSPYGEVSFSTLTITPTGPFKLSAKASTTPAKLSNEFKIVNDLAACLGTQCKNNTGNTVQKAFGKITATGQSFYSGSTNVLLTTQFVAGDTANCGSPKPIGGATDVRIQGTGAAGTTPDTLMVLVIPKNTLKASGVLSRGTTSFNVCLGTINLDHPTTLGTPWKQKNTKKGGLIDATHVTETSGEIRYWGTPADCETPLLPAADPCIALRTKQVSALAAYPGITAQDIAALKVTDADLMIVVRKRSPWDGRGTIN